MKLKLYSTSSKRKFFQKGFTLLESLLTLMIFSLIMHALTISVQSFSRLNRVVENDQTLEWQNFMILFQRELELYNLNSISAKEINLIEREGDRLTFQVVLHNQKIYRKPGHHPYLYGVKEWHLNLKGSFLSVFVEMVDGQLFFGSFKVNFIE